MTHPLVRAHAADAITGLRILLAIPFVLCVLDGATSLGWVAGVLFAIIAASDVADGIVARRFGAASEQGRILDHFADIGFLLIAFSTFVFIGSAPWWVPAAIAGSFGFYVIDSWRQSNPRQPSLIGSRIGHASGVLNYALIGVIVFNDSAGIGALSETVMYGLFACVPVYSGAAVAARILGSPTANRK